MYDYRDVLEWFKDAFKYIITIVIILFIAIYIITLQQIIGPSMSPNLNDNDVLLLNKTAYIFKNVKRFDVIAIKYENIKYLVKRVIGLPGETIEYKNNILYVDGKAIKESFLTKSVNTNDYLISDLGYEKIPPNMYLVLGDNREDSLDSRDFGLIDKKNIIGKALIKIWPLTEIKIVK